MKHIHLLPLAAALLLAACTGSVDPDPSDWDNDSSASAGSQTSVTASESASVRETPNVSYEGTVREAGISIYMQGTHALELEDGRTVLLESDKIDLDRYLGDRVTVFGSSRPTVEGSGIIMRVEEVLQMESDDASSEASSQASEDAASSPDASSAPAAALSSAGAVSSPMAASTASVAAAQTSSLSQTDVSADVSARAAVMAKDSLAEANWSRQYCTSHIGFCIPVHKNWWFKSFGTTSSSLWHVEISNGEIQNLGEGAISVRLVSGSVGAARATDGQVRPEGDTVTGFRSWPGNQHFEITAPATLEAAVAYITAHLSSTPTEQ